MYRAKIRDCDRLYPVSKVVCVARNYAQHAAELNNPTTSEPTVFIKPNSSIIGEGEQVVIPAYSQQCHHEVELAVLIGKWGKHISQKQALKHVAGYGVGLDMTLRDTQQQLKDKGLPWEWAKAFDTSCPLSHFVPAREVADPQNLELKLWVNNELRQQGHTCYMLHSVAQLISYMSTAFTLKEGDVILTGTPAGVDQVHSGDRLRAEISQVTSLEVSMQ